MEESYEKYRKEAVKTRRILHMFPEQAWMEVRTTVFLIKVLEQFGYTVEYGRRIHGVRTGVPPKEDYDKVRERNRDVYEERLEEVFQGYTGVTAALDTGNEGETVGFRFDLDGLPVKECEEQKHFPAREGFLSQHPGEMHACGHDGHMAVGIALAHYAVDHREMLHGRVVFIFQPAEEGVRGAKSLLTSGHFPKLDKLFGMHIGLGMEAGVVGVGTGGFLGSEHLNIYFHGKPAHAANAPEEGRNTLLSAASATLAIHSLPQYGNGKARVNVGTMEAGTGRNVIAEDAVLGVNVRADREEIFADMHGRVLQASEGAAKMFGTKCRAEVVGQADCYARADEEMTRETAGILKKAGFAVRCFPDFRASEDVTILMHAVEQSGGKALHLMIGARLAAGHHTNEFDFDEEALTLAFEALAEVLKAYAGK